VAGGVTISADSAPQINATVSNAAETTASSLYGAQGGAAGAIISSNRLSSGAHAYIDYSPTYVTVGLADFEAGGTVSVTSSDVAGI
jgi:hypothetical protein